MRSEWPLVLFTLLGQAAVGTFAAAGALRLLAGRQLPDEVAASLVRAPLAAALALLALAALSSVGHLRRPLRAWRALRHARASWLSVEVLLFTAFSGLAAATALLEWANGPGVLREATGAVAACAGAGLLYAMGRLYRLPSRPAWNHPLTPLAFFATAGLLGTLLVASAVAFTGPVLVGRAGFFPDRLLALDRLIRLLLAAAGALLAAELSLIHAQAAVRREASAGSALPESRRGLARLQHIVIARSVLTMAALALAGWFLLRQPPLSVAEPEGALVIWLVFWFAAVESLIGRTAFYRERPVAGV